MDSFIHIFSYFDIQIWQDLLLYICVVGNLGSTSSNQGRPAPTRAAKHIDTEHQIFENNFSPLDSWQPQSWKYKFQSQLYLLKSKLVKSNWKCEYFVTIKPFFIPKHTKISLTEAKTFPLKLL